MNTEGWFFASLTVFILGGLALITLTFFPQGQSTAPPEPMGVAWRAITPPHTGLRCWFAYTGQEGGVAYCEPDPTATHGASP